jgi:hypothetical protein
VNLYIKTNVRSPPPKGKSEKKKVMPVVITFVQLLWGEDQHMFLLHRLFKAPKKIIKIFICAIEHTLYIGT